VRCLYTSPRRIGGGAAFFFHVPGHTAVDWVASSKVRNVHRHRPRSAPRSLPRRSDGRPHSVQQGPHTEQFLLPPDRPTGHRPALPSTASPAHLADAPHCGCVGLCLPGCLPAWLPACWRHCLLAWRPYCLTAGLPACLPPGAPTDTPMPPAGSWPRPPGLPRASLPAYLLPCVAASPPRCLLASLLATLAGCLATPCGGWLPAASKGSASPCVSLPPSHCLSLSSCIWCCVCLSCTPSQTVCRTVRLPGDRPACTALSLSTCLPCYQSACVHLSASHSLWRLRVCPGLRL
jgi:hypothetical protein